jgi:Domain of unknown function (DUF6438)
MLRVQIISLLCLSLIYGGCSSAEVARNNPAPAGPTAASQAVPSDTLIILERLECDLTCPVYKLTISADGKVIFEGRRFVKRTGIIKSSISQEQLKELISEFERVNYFSLKDKYAPGNNCPEAATDYPSAITSIRSNRKSKSIEHYYGCRGNDTLQELTNLEGKIDEIINTQQWIK